MLFRENNGREHIIHSDSNALESQESTQPQVHAITPAIKMDYLLSFICGGVGGGIILFTLVSGTTYLVLRSKRKKRAESQLSLELPVQPNSQNSTLACHINGSVNKTLIYSRLLKFDFVKDENDNEPMQAFDTENLPIVPFLTEEFKGPKVPSDPKAADKLLREALEEPLIKDRAGKLLQAVYVFQIHFTH